MTDQKKHLWGDLILLCTAFVWGMGFVAQRSSVKYIGPLGYNGIRFFLGALTLLPLYAFQKKKGVYTHAVRVNLKHGIIAGTLLWGGATLQQLGILYTSAGKAGFITGLYVVMVPLTGIFLGYVLRVQVLAGAVMSACGLFLLSVTSDFTLNKGDTIVFSSTIFWTLHILYIGHHARSYDSLPLSIIQFFVCGLFSILLSLPLEKIETICIEEALIPILYGGIASVGLGYTLQVFGQRFALPSHSAIILSMESVFAALGAFILLGEFMSPRSIAGCALMLCGMILSQLFSRYRI